VLIDLLVMHNYELIQITTKGETYSAEYYSCKRCIETIQKELSIRNHSLNFKNFACGDFKKVYSVSGEQPVAPITPQAKELK